jgi:preprotein translocase subunit SecA
MPYCSLILFQQFKPVVKNQEEEKPQNKGSKKKVDKGANKLGAAQAAS